MIFDLKRSILFKNRINWLAVVLLLALMQGLLLYGHVGDAYAAASGEWSDYAAAGFAEGSGDGSSDTTPYLISSAEQLAYLAKMVQSGNDYSGKYFMLTADLDLSAHEWFPIGVADTFFAGNFNGGHHVISGLTFNASDCDGVGLFGTAFGGSISNVGLDNAAITGRWYIGALAGACGSSVSSCYATGTVNGESCVGGLVGYCLSACISNSWADVTTVGTEGTGGLVGASQGTVIKCYATGQVTGTTNTGGLIGNLFEDSNVSDSYATGSVSGGNKTGGFIGIFDLGTIDHCYATGDVSGNIYLGGFAGDITAGNRTVKNCFCTGTVTPGGSTTYVGGFAGHLGADGSTALKCYYVDNTYGTSGIGTIDEGNGGYTCSQQSDPFYSTLASYTTSSNWETAWDMTATWAIASGASYPTLINKASGITAGAAAKSTPENGKVMLSFNPSAAADHKLYYRVVSSAPSAPDVGAAFTTDGWTVISTASPLEVSSADGSYIEVAEVKDADSTVTKWGKTTATDDGYTNFGVITLTGTAGNRRVILNWTSAADAVNYAVYQSITSGIYGDALATVAGTVYEVGGLTNGTAYYFMVKGFFNGGDSISSNEVKAIPHKNSSDAPSNSGGNGSSESSGSTSNTATPVTGENTVNIQVNGVNQNLATATTATVNNRTVTTVVLNDSQLNKMLAGEGNKAVITIPIINNTDVAIGQLNGQTVKNMESKEAVLQIKTENATYTLPAAQINIDAVSAQIGQDVKLSDITVSIEIAQAAEQTVKVVENAASQGNFSIVVPPVEFTVTCTYADKTVNVSQFNSYVERTIAIPDGVDPSKITTGIIVEPDGTTRHVPTQIVQIDGKYYAKINSLTNSTYSVIWNPLEFQDIAHHWAKDAVNDMGSRMVISGAGQDTFEPDRDITRAEFAAIIVRALGLKPGTGSNQFTDVSDKDWYGDYVKTASENKIISGYGDGQFGPEDRISREQAFAMIARTMDITGLKTEIAAGEADKLLTKFSDANQASDYARSSIAECLKTAIASGRNGGLIAPKDNITRAEAAVMVQKLLQKSNLI